MSKDDTRERPHEPRVERPRYEPEIIPPARERDEQVENVFVFTDREGRTHRLKVSRPRPFTVIMVLVLFALISSVILALLLGALLIWIPVAAAIIVSMIGYAYVRGFWQRLRGGQ